MWGGGAQVTVASSLSKFIVNPEKLFLTLRFGRLLVAGEVFFERVTE